MRPMVISHEGGELRIEEADESRMVCHSTQVLGDGVIANIKDVVYVDIDRFERAASKEVAEEIGEFNAPAPRPPTPRTFSSESAAGGSSDPWLGIPVSWDQIQARV